MSFLRLVNDQTQGGDRYCSYLLPNGMVEHPMYIEVNLFQSMTTLYLGERFAQVCRTRWHAIKL